MMIKRIQLIAAMCTIALIATPSAFAQDDKVDGLSIGVLLGPSIPEENISDVYNLAKRKGDSISDVYSVAEGLGYHIGAHGRIGLTPALSLSGGIEYVRFPGNKIEILYSSNSQKKLVLNTIANYVPISAGFTLRPFSSIVTPYILGEAVYTYSNVTLADADDGILTTLLAPGQELEPTRSNLGAAVALGLEVNLVVVKPFLEFRYTMSNLVSKNENDLSKSWLNISLGINF